MRIRLNDKEDRLELDFAGEVGNEAAPVARDGGRSFAFTPPNSLNTIGVEIDVAGYVRRVTVTGLGILVSDLGGPVDRAVAGARGKRR